MSGLVSISDGAGQRAKAVSNWLLGDVSRLLNASSIEIEESNLTPSHLTGLLDLLDSGSISGSAAKQALDVMFSSGKMAAQVVEEQGLSQISGVDELAASVERVIAENPQAVADYLAGKDQAIGFLVGQVMRETRGRANPNIVGNLLRQKLVT